MLVLAVALAVCPAYAKARGAESLLSVYAAARPILDDPDQRNPFYLRAAVKKNEQAGEAAMYFDQPFSEIADTLRRLRTLSAIPAVGAPF